MKVKNYLPQILKDKIILECIIDNKSTSDLGAKYNVDASTISKWVRTYKMYNIGRFEKYGNKDNFEYITKKSENKPNETSVQKDCLSKKLSIPRDKDESELGYFVRSLANQLMNMSKEISELHRNMFRN